MQTKSSADKPSIGMKKGTFFLLILIGFLLLGSSSVLPPFPNVGVLQIQHPEAFDRIFAISDVHGMLPHLKDLLQANHIITGDGDWSAGNSLLIIVGDSVDKGPDSLGVLALWEKLALQTTNAGVGRVVHLLGNHEAEFLADPEGDRTADFRDELKSHSLFDQALNPQTTLGGMLRSMPVAARVGNWLFCHAGFYPNMNWPDFVSSSQSLLSAGNYAHFVVDTQSVLEAKDWWNTTDGTKTVESRLASNHLYGVVFGHQPKALGVEDDVGGIDSLHIIKIDSGMAPAKEEGAHGNFGHLLFFPHASDLNLMSPPAAFSLGVNSSRQL